MMLIKQYRHRLPADYDMTNIRERALKGGPLFDHRAGMAFKAFSIEERGKAGATENAYSSLYLWFEAQAVLDFIWYPGFQNVFDTFGRPAVHMWLPLEALRGPADRGTMLYQRQFSVPHGIGLAALKDEVAERTRNHCTKQQNYIAMTGLDVQTWQLTEFIITDGIDDEKAEWQAFQIAYLAQPGVEQLQRAGA